METRWYKLHEEFKTLMLNNVYGKVRSKGSKKWAPNLEFTKFQFSMKFQFLHSSFVFRIMLLESANHTESTGDAEEKSARSYELEFAPN
jgi:hypothetical protein